MIKVSIWCDTPIISLGLEHAFGELEDIDLMDGINDPARIGDLEEGDIDVVIVCCNDLSKLPTYFKARNNGIPILIISSDDDFKQAIGLLGGNIRGYCLQSQDVARVVVAVREVADGKAYLDPALVSELITDAKGHMDQFELGENKEVLEELSERQIQVFRLLARGHTNQQMATTLGITERTIRHHLRSLYDKLNLNSRSEAIAMGARLFP